MEKQAKKLVTRINKSNNSFGCMGAMMLGLEFQTMDKELKLEVIRIANEKGVSLKSFPELTNV